MKQLVCTLSTNGWTVKPTVRAPSRVSTLAVQMPDDVWRICTTFDLLISPDETAWFLSHLDYFGTSDSAFKWNEFELNDFDACVTDNQRTSVQHFWRRHFPIAMSVKDDHSYLAIGTDSNSNAGQIFVGDNSDENDVVLVADNLGAFIELVDGLFRGATVAALSPFF